MSERIVCRFSCGAASAVATKLTLAAHDPATVEIWNCDTGSEHPDSKRFMADCERWFGHPITTLPQGKYKNTWEVWRGERFITSKEGAPCTGFLKRAPAYSFQRLNDTHVFGYTADRPDSLRADRLRLTNPELSIRTPLIEAGLMKSDCLAMIERAGIKLPAMYLLGYHNNNCIGCPKGGMGYWNKIRIDFPQVYIEMMDLQEELGPGSAFWREKDGTPILLKDLDPSRGNHDEEPKIECSLLCFAAEHDFDEEPTMSDRSPVNAGRGKMSPQAAVGYGRWPDELRRGGRQSKHWKKPDNAKPKGKKPVRESTS